MHQHVRTSYTQCMYTKSLFNGTILTNSICSAKRSTFDVLYVGIHTQGELWQVHFHNQMRVVLNHFPKGVSNTLSLCRTNYVQPNLRQINMFQYKNILNIDNCVRKPTMSLVRLLYDC